MTPERKKAVEQVRALVLDVVARVDARVYLFGSCADDTARRYSDIDVAIDPRRTLPPGLLSEIRERLEESTIPYEVELVDLSTTDQSLREHVRRKGAAWRG